mmetsp:Transcript_10639/g.15016  ORF Transcript_10639/g.15016 Transcript_10639/m.15016 type:complete len:282 (+) Transcript_10639:76-921(+)
MNISSLKASLVYFKDPWVLGWVVSGAVAIIIPIISWTSQRGYYYNMYGYLQKLEDEERYYEEQQKDQEEGDGGDGNYYNYYKDCSWINYACRKQQYKYAMMDGSGDGDRPQQNIPYWFIWLAGDDSSEELRRWKEENTGMRASQQGSPGMNLAYALTLVMFASIIAYGAITIAQKQNKSNFLIFLGLTTLFAFMNMVISATSVTSGDDKDMEESYYGWYGQTGVLMTYTYLWIMLFSGSFLIALGIKSYLEKKTESNDDTEGAEKGDYEDAGKGDYTAPVV